MSGKYIKLSLLFILFTGALLRIFGFPQYPPGINRDEAALGYNAYSILETGKDEWGEQYPVVFRSFGDYKLAGYIYSLVPVVKVFGLNHFSVRLPSLVAGVLLPLVGFALVSTLTGKKEIGIFTAAAVALSPWAIFYSKVGYEANLALVFFISGLISLILAKSRLKLIFLSAVLLFISLLTYNAPLILLPFVLGVFVLGKKTKIVHAVLIFIVAVAAFALVYPATAGKGTITVFSDHNLTETQRSLRLASQDNLVKRVWYHPVIFFSIEVGKNYIDSFHPKFLVTDGGTNPWHQVPGTA